MSYLIPILMIISCTVFGNSNLEFPNPVEKTDPKTSFDHLQTSVTSLEDGTCCINTFASAFEKTFNSPIHIEQLEETLFNYILSSELTAATQHDLIQVLEYYLKSFAENPNFLFCKYEETPEEDIAVGVIVGGIEMLADGLRRALNSSEEEGHN